MRPITTFQPIRLRPVRWQTNALRRLRMNVTFDGFRPATQQQLAHTIGVSFDRYFKLEMGRSPATPRERRELARFFRCSERELLLDLSRVRLTERATAPTKRFRRIA